MRLSTVVPHSEPSSTKKADVIDLTLESSSDEESDPDPPLKKRCVYMSKPEEVHSSKGLVIVFTNESASLAHIQFFWGLKVLSLRQGRFRELGISVWLLNHSYLNHNIIKQEEEGYHFFFFFSQGFVLSAINIASAKYPATGHFLFNFLHCRLCSSIPPFNAVHNSHRYARYTIVFVITYIFVYKCIRNHWLTTTLFLVQVSTYFRSFKQILRYVFQICQYIK